MCQQLIGDINHVRGYRYFTRVQLRLLSGLKSLIKHHSSCSKQYSYFHALANWKCDVDMHKFLGITQTEKSNMFFCSFDRTLELHLTYSPISLFRWQMYESQRMRQKWFSVLGDEPEQTEEEQDYIKVCFRL